MLEYTFSNVCNFIFSFKGNSQKTTLGPVIHRPGLKIKKAEGIFDAKVKSKIISRPTIGEPNYHKKI